MVLGCLSYYDLLQDLRIGRPAEDHRVCLVKTIEYVLEKTIEYVEDLTEQPQPNNKQQQQTTTNNNKQTTNKQQQQAGSSYAGTCL